MSSRREVNYVWECDACGHVQTVDDSGPGRPPSKDGWRQIVIGSLHEALGNLSAKHLCGMCADNLSRLLAGRLGDVGDMAQAWEEGWDAHVDYGGANADMPPNPYRDGGDGE